MPQLTKLDPRTVAEKLESGAITLVDIRGPDERAREYIVGSTSAPIASLASQGLRLEAADTVVFHCRTGMRTDSNCDLLAASVDGEAFILEGGIDAWKKAGLPTQTHASAPLEINRQIQITAGLLVLASVGLGALIHPAFYGLSAFIGADLIVSGLSGSGGVASALKAMPWNRSPVTA